MIIIYCIIIFAATFLGALVGLGGGVIIKPLLDLIGHDTIDVVNFISSCAVFSMSISSTLRHIKAKTKIDFKFILTLSVGAVLGGAGGAALFDYLLTIFDNSIMKSIQGIILGVLLVLSVVYVNLKKAKSFNVKNPVGIAGVGLALGFIASFLGVGGGPINVAFLVLFFSMTMKEAAIYSVGTIFFSQLSKLITIGISHSVPSVSAITLISAIAAAVIGGILGAIANKRCNEKMIKTTFTIVVILLALVNFYNAIAGFVKVY
ncbi:MAG: sulfite exporter TauE/SafE family protein [Acetobacter sp.]|nr:sulfite exporter TauE/SafE family protein [Bacteroides sp.]MCM1341514.1 sulfite exporter TauE/SafE family protein [Acetobacter sp.]MCM1433698.1 sulfite exporter TauE/SafE family protein [Clostridiales bacterium]